MIRIFQYHANYCNEINDRMVKQALPFYDVLNNLIKMLEKDTFTSEILRL